MSLRDVERAMQVMVWFFKHVDTLGRLMRRVIIQQRREGVEVENDDNDEEDEVIMVSLLDKLYQNLTYLGNRWTSNFAGHFPVYISVKMFFVFSKIYRISIQSTDRKWETFFKYFFLRFSVDFLNERIFWYH